MALVELSSSPDVRAEKALVPAHADERGPFRGSEAAQVPLIARLPRRVGLGSVRSGVRDGGKAAGLGVSRPRPRGPQLVTIDRVEDFHFLSKHHPFTQQ